MYVYGFHRKIFLHLLGTILISASASAECVTDVNGARFCDRAPSAARPVTDEAERKPATTSEKEDAICEVQPFGGGTICKKKADRGVCHYDGVMERCYGDADDKKGQYCFFDGLMERCMDRKPSRAQAE